MGPFSSPDCKPIANLGFSLSEGLSGTMRREVDPEFCGSGCQDDGEAPQQPHMRVAGGAATLVLLPRDQRVHKEVAAGETCCCKGEEHPEP